jgi:hypothetical protein
MAKQIRFEYDGKEYTLEFTRKSIETMERQGFVASDIVDKPMTTLPALFAGAFLAHHRYIKKELVDEIYSKMTNKQDLLSKLAEMYNEPIQALMEEPEDAVGNVKWEASF